ncbi:putative disease resistance protein, partial [Quercus suber]
KRRRRRSKVIPLSIAGPLPGAGFGQVFTLLRDAVKDVVSKARQIKPILKRLESTLDRLAPTVTDIERLNQQLNRPVEETQSLIEEMTKGGELFRECLQIPRWNLYLRFKYSSKLTKLEEDILRYCQVDLQLHDARTGLETRKIVSDISQRMDSIASVETPKVSFAVHEPPDFTVGFDMPMKELKTLLLKEEVQLLLLTAPGGCGKTTLVQMLCQDEIIKGTSLSFVCRKCGRFGPVLNGTGHRRNCDPWHRRPGMFENNILFVNVSKTPNVKVIVQNLFNYMNMQPEFQIQSDDDAIHQLSQLPNHITPNPILLILDDVWLGSKYLLSFIPKRWTEKKQKLINARLLSFSTGWHISSLAHYVNYIIMSAYHTLYNSFCR